MSWFVSDIRTPNSARLRWQSEGCDMSWLVSDIRMSLTNQDISQPSLCHLSLGSSMVRASHRRSEGCGFDSRLGLRNIFWDCESLSSQKVFL